MENNSLHQAFLETMHRFRRSNLMSIPGHLTKGEFFMLGMLIKHRASHPEAQGIYVSSLAEMLEISMPAVSRMLRSLETGGLIDRNVDRENRRNTYIQITSSGEQAWKDTMHCMHEIMSRVISSIGEQDIRTLLTLINRLTDVLQREIQREGKQKEEQTEGETE